jgi:hypothetical protein
MPDVFYRLYHGGNSKTVYFWHLNIRKNKLKVAFTAFGKQLFLETTYCFKSSRELYA